MMNHSEAKKSAALINKTCPEFEAQFLHAGSESGYVDVATKEWETHEDGTRTRAGTTLQTTEQVADWIMSNTPRYTVEKQSFPGRIAPTWAVVRADGSNRRADGTNHSCGSTTFPLKRQAVKRCDAMNRS